MRCSGPSSPGNSDEARAPLAAGERMVPVLEVVDARCELQPPTWLDRLADSYGASMLLLGGGTPPSELPLDRLTVRLETDALQGALEQHAPLRLGREAIA